MSTKLQISPSNFSYIAQVQVPTSIHVKPELKKAGSYRKGIKDLGSATLRKGEESTKIKKVPIKVNQTNRAS
jgi:hypothetical protein